MESLMPIMLKDGNSGTIHLANEELRGLLQVRTICGTLSSTTWFALHQTEDTATCQRCMQVRKAMIKRGQYQGG